MGRSGRHAVVTPMDLLAAVQESRRERFSGDGLVLRCHPGVWHELQFADPCPPTPGRPDQWGRRDTYLPQDGPPTIIGLTVCIDEHLPALVWRLCDEDMTLIYDCREGTNTL